MIATQKLRSVVRVANGEWSVIAGLISDSRSKSKPAVARLEGIPLLGNLFRQTSIDNESQSILIGIRPYIVSGGPEETVTKKLASGIDARPYLPL